MMTTEMSDLLLAIGIFALGFISIGPNILAIIGTSMQRGRRCGVQLALGVGSGTAAWASLTVMGLTALISSYAVVISVLKIFGAAYLAWLAVKAFRSASTPAHAYKPQATQGNNLFTQGLIIQLTNPKAALQWIAIVGIGLGDNPSPAVGLTLVTVATGLSLAVHVLYAITFSTTTVVLAYQRARRWIEGALGVFFGVAAFKVATYNR